MLPTKIAEISRDDLKSSEVAKASIADVKHLASYSWVEAPTPTIAVPGIPPLWSPPSGPKKLAKDSGLVYIAQNAARHPESPLEPLFQALYTTNPSFNMSAIDVITDRNNIRKLLSFVNPSLAKHGLENFAINVEAIKETVVFCRMESVTQEFIQPYEFKGFGHEFEKAYTVNQIPDATGHHRIISYRFGDMTWIVRHETDGYVDFGQESSSSKAEMPEPDDISGLLESLSLSPSTPAGSKLTIRREGRVVPLCSTLELKTRVLHKPLDIEEVAPQLWVSQTPNLVRAYHQKGIFQKPEVEDVTAKVRAWEEHHQDDLKKLATLIDKIRSEVKKCGGNAVLRYEALLGRLIIFKSSEKKLLPDELYSKLGQSDSTAPKINVSEPECRLKEPAEACLKKSRKEKSHDSL